MSESTMILIGGGAIIAALASLADMLHRVTVAPREAQLDRYQPRLPVERYRRKSI